MTREERQSRSNVGKNDGSGRHPDHKNAEHKTKIAHASSDERFFRRVGRGIAFEPMTDQDVGGKANQLPEDEQHDEVVGEDNSKHGEHEQRERGEITGFAFIASHVA